MLINSEIILLHLIDSCQHVACELKGRVVAKENVGWLKSKVSWHGCDMLVNFCRAFKPGKNKIMLTGQTERENSEQYNYYLNRVTSHRVTKT